MPPKRKNTVDYYVNEALDALWETADSEIPDDWEDVDASEATSTTVSDKHTNTEEDPGKQKADREQDGENDWEEIDASEAPSSSSVAGKKKKTNQGQGNTWMRLILQYFSKSLVE
ncbi:hypothetical protein G7Y89_g2961 [Cudoniella acicularis]|uniref:Uncharacterized protein n=1 Tax=Cudoniella acicularis TaxID=354080 RepID=A0A8H4W5M6_9HELO|nr:hypothetical protein G7Y89_g2961 [Cudoniella acicularis]